MNKKIMSKISIVTAYALFLSLFLTGPAMAQDPIKIGFVASITGGASFLGQPEKDTALMVQEWINKEGGIKGVPVQIIIEDSKSDPSQAVLATKKLIEGDKVVAIIGSSTSGESMAMAPICETAQIPMIHGGRSADRDAG
jgi:branched-chain amino acid transport system substrate-binding protein